jgi:hypothetical protein
VDRVESGAQGCRGCSESGFGVSEGGDGEPRSDAAEGGVA